MKVPKLYFAGFNGFGQFENSKCILDEFTEVNVQSFCGVEFTELIESFQINYSWQYVALAINSALYLRGCLNRGLSTVKNISFESNIKALATNENYCLILLASGIAYKLCVNTFEINEINHLILHPSEGNSKKAIFGDLSPAQENARNSECEETLAHIACCRSFAVAISNKNAVYQIPLKIHTFPSHIKIKKVCCGNEHCLILTTNGDVYGFGSSTRGQLGIGTLETEEKPILIEALAGIKIIDIAASGWHSAAISAFNDLYMWGWNVNGQMGLPIYKQIEANRTKDKKEKLPTVFASPIIIDLPKNDNEDDIDSQYSVSNVSMGTRHTFLKTTDGRILASGWNKYGQLGNSDLDNDVVKFELVERPSVESADFEILCEGWCTIIIFK